MNKRSLGALVALNIVLLVGLVFVSLSPEPAYGQVKRAEYIMVAGNATGRSQQAAVFVIELNTSRMVAFFFNAADNRIDIIDARDMTQDMELVGGGR